MNGVIRPPNKHLKENINNITFTCFQFSFLRARKNITYIKQVDTKNVQRCGFHYNFEVNYLIDSNETDIFEKKTFSKDLNFSVKYETCRKVITQFTMRMTTPNAGHIHFTSAILPLKRLFTILERRCTEFKSAYLATLQFLPPLCFFLEFLFAVAPKTTQHLCNWLWNSLWWPRGYI